MKNIIIIVVCILLAWVVSLLAQADKIIFSHQFHLEEAGAECTDCHTTVKSSLSPSDNLLPSMETCFTCHDENSTECSLCHTNSNEAEDLPRITGLKAKFAHKIHIDAGEECIACHKGIEESVETGVASYSPDRQVCTDCHGAADLREENTKCITCHGEDFEFKPMNHNISWNKDHGINWQIQENSCTHCHSQSYCQDCHQGDNLDRQIHPLNYRMSHGLDARANKENCLTCHQEYTFCNDCHLIEMVIPKNHSYPSWSNFTDGGLHVREAQYDFDYCQSCHSDANSEVVCVKCHGR